MKLSGQAHRARGFTIIELVTVVSIAAILAAVAAPSFSEFLSKRRVEGVTSELVTDLHFARSEAVSRNESVRMTFGTDCYVIHRAVVSASATAATCDRTSKSISPPAAEIKTVQLDTARPVTIAPAVAFVEFDPVRGTAANDLTSPPGPATVDVRSTSGRAWQLRAVLTLMGRVATCSPSGSGYFTGYSSNCS